VGGDINLYRYVQNNPVNRIDPYGLVDKGFLENAGIEFVIGQKLKESIPSAPAKLRSQASRALREEITDEELRFLQHPQATEAEKEQVTETAIKRALSNPKNEKVKKEIDPHLPPQFKSSSQVGGEACPLTNGGQGDT
jgi:hypothetical protein